MGHFKEGAIMALLLLGPVWVAILAIWLIAFGDKFMHYFKGFCSGLNLGKGEFVRKFGSPVLCILIAVVAHYTGHNTVTAFALVFALLSA